LEERLNFFSVRQYIHSFLKTGNVRLINLKGIDVNIVEFMFLWQESAISILDLTNCRLEFYQNKKKLNSCQDNVDLNITEIQSVFQFNPYEIILRNVEYKRAICPIVFKNSMILIFPIIFLSDTFYKRNVLQFSNDTFTDLNSYILFVSLIHIQNINIDLNLIHPSVFKNLEELEIKEGWLNSINGDVFKHLAYFQKLSIKPKVLKKINHKQGIEWIRKMNYGINVNLSTTKFISIMLFQDYDTLNHEISKIFPDEDFCIYVDFPFNQNIFLYSIIRSKTISLTLDKDSTCTYLWLAQNLEYYKDKDTIEFERL
jgi:hypothetical protein